VSDTPTFVDSGDVRLAVYESGDPAGEPVVLLHGLTGTHEYVLMRNRRLDRHGYRTISYDARGHGRSSRAASHAYEYTDLVADLEAVMDGFGIDSALMVGSSMGGHTALRYALGQPARVNGVVFITPAYHPVGSFRPETLARWDALADALEAGGIDGFADAYGHPFGGTEEFDAVMRLVRNRLELHDDLGGVIDALRVVPRARPYREIADVGALDQPALVIGSHDDFDIEHPLAVAEEHAAALGAELVLEERGRYPIAWSGGRTARTVHRFAVETADARGGVGVA
jgi:3-oxoadipate enol-lactonase